LGLKEATSVDIISGLLEGALDVGLVRTPIFGTPRVEITPLASEHMVLAVPRGHRFESRSEVRLEELGGEPLIMWNREAEPWFQSLIELSFSKVAISPTVVEEASHVHTVLALVECGVGGALVPSVLRRSGTGRVRLVDVTCQGQPIPIGFAMAVRVDHPRRIASHFIKVATEVIRDPSWHSLLAPHGG
jgi:DNA-binding transcriptional LysR family regulator